MRHDTGIRTSARRVARLAIAGAILFGAASCSSGGETSTTGTTAPPTTAAPAAKGPAAKGPAAKAGAAGKTGTTKANKDKAPACQPIGQFQTFNYAATVYDAKKTPEKKDSIVKGLDETYTKAAAAVPDLMLAIRVVASTQRANVTGDPKPTPGAGEPTFEAAQKQLQDWQKANC